jgi:tRNA (guanine-N7-)-methyltransferase
MPDVAARIRTFHPRRGRLGDRRRDVLSRLWPAYGVAVPERGAPLDPVALFGRRAPLVLEIGSGMGDATAEMAAADPGRDYLAVDVHTPGVAHLLSLVERRGLRNVRVAHGDALDLVTHQLGPGTLDAVHVFFPDPWPKTRHHKRRLIQPATVALLASRLVPCGTLHCATDWPDYAHAALSALTAEPLLVNAYYGFAPRPAHRPRTRFEERGLRAGRPVFDLVFRRRLAPDARGPR